MVRLEAGLFSCRTHRAMLLPGFACADIRRPDHGRDFTKIMADRRADSGGLIFLPAQSIVDHDGNSGRAADYESMAF